MKSPLPFGGRCLMAGLLASMAAAGIAPAADSAIPRGTLTIDRNWVRAGTKPQLAWEIEYPAPVTGVVDIQPPNIITPKTDLKMKVRLLGAAFQRTKTDQGHGNNADGVDSSNPGSGGPGGTVDPSDGIDDERKGVPTTFLPVEVLWSLNGTSWAQLFCGYQSNIDPAKVLLETTVKAGDTVNFGARGWRDGSWLAFHDTGRSTNNLILLKNGDRVPTTVPALNGSSIETFLRPYMDTVAKCVRIGDRDLILLLELGQTKPSASGFDLQDLVILVTFE